MKTKFASVILCILLVACFSSYSFAAVSATKDITLKGIGVDTTDTSIIQGYTIHRFSIPKYKRIGKLQCYWYETASRIYVGVKNEGTAKVKVSAKITLKSRSGSKYGRWKKQSRTVKFCAYSKDNEYGICNWNLTTAYRQNYTIKYTITSGKVKEIKSRADVRKLDTYLVKAWNHGTFNNVEDSLKYHYTKHGVGELSQSNIRIYAYEAYTYKNKCAEGTGRVSDSSSDSWKWNFTDPQRYIMLDHNAPNGLIYTFGK